MSHTSQEKSLQTAHFAGVPVSFPSRLITSEAHFRSQLEGLMLSSEPEGAVKEALQRTMLYLRKVLGGEGEKPLCPFVQAIEAQNGYHVTPYAEHPKDLDLESIVNTLREEFMGISPTRTMRSQPVDTTTVVAAFAHPQAVSRRFCSGVTDIRNQRRVGFLQQGLMLSQMHPFHELGSASTRKIEPGSDPLYTSEIPLLMVRRMHAPDHVFMKTVAERKAYEQFFGPIPNAQKP